MQLKTKIMLMAGFAALSAILAAFCLFAILKFVPERTAWTLDKKAVAKQVNEYSRFYADLNYDMDLKRRFVDYGEEIPADIKDRTDTAKLVERVIQRDTMVVKGRALADLEKTVSALPKDEFYASFYTGKTKIGPFERKAWKTMALAGWLVLNILLAMVMFDHE